MYYIGVDLGTSSVKLILMDAGGDIIKSVSKSYPLSFPRSGWSEQDPYQWFDRTMEGLHELLEGTDRSLVKGMSFGGQMHGLVVLDEDDRVIRPAILWNDGRTDKETDYLNDTVGKDFLSAHTANIAFAGFTAPKILWMRENEPELFKRIKKIMLPKDYLQYRLTGVFATDVSDASGMLLLDVKNRKWSDEMLGLLQIKKEMLPGLYESSEITGKLLPEIADELGLKEVFVTAGAGDNAAAAVGTGTIGEGRCNISLGTSGTVFISSSSFRVDANNALHSFCHVDGSWHLMGCMLSAASCVKWWSEEILKSSDLDKEQKDISELGKNEVYFLPYLMGERSPHNDPFARGVFAGMTMNTKREDMMQAVMEGVAFALRDSVEVARSLGTDIPVTRICGGGAKSRLWIRILANVLGIDVEIPELDEGPGLGAAILAAVACGEYASVEEACSKIVRVKERISPDPELTELYDRKYRVFRELYPALKPAFRTMNAALI